MSKFFIERPIFAWVLAIIIMLAGLFALIKIPIEQYPNIAPPSVSIDTNLPGASAETIENSVTQVIEQSMTGLDNLRYISSSSDSDGNVSVGLTFEPGANPDVAQMQVQNKLQSAMPLLPQGVQAQGVYVRKANNNFLLVFAIYTENEKFPYYDMGDILMTDFREQISRINGVGNTLVFGSAKSMRIWLNPAKLSLYNMTTMDVINAVKSQNIDVAAGQLGGLPAVKGQQINVTIVARSKLQTVKEFEDILLRVNDNGSVVKIKDIARVEIGAQNYSTIGKYNGKPAAVMAVVLASGANAIQTVAAVKAKVSDIQRNLPSELKIVYTYDSTPFVKLSIINIVKTLIEAVILVFLVMYIFLQNFRATLIPTIAIPVVLLGTFAVLYILGFSLNTFTMFAMVLVIGLLVDDAIVVVENVERIIENEGLSPKDATIKSMSQITGALIGIGVVLSVVFIPMAFFGGAVGAIYRQFAVTIVIAMGFSVLVALILSPALCALLLKPHNHVHNKYVSFFNSILNKVMSFYFHSSSYIIKKSSRFIIVYIIMIAALIILLNRMPTSFLPVEDQGTMYLTLNTPTGATLERTIKSLKQAEEYFLTEESHNVEHILTIAGYSRAGQSQNSGFGFIALKPWDKRTHKDQSVVSVSARSTKELNKISDATSFTFFPPPIRELGNSSGFDLHLIDRAGLGHVALMNARDQLLSDAKQNKLLTNVRHNGLNDVPQLKLNINYHKAMSLGLTITDVTQTLQTAIGSSYINDFLDKGRVKKVFIQGDAQYRMLSNDIGRWYIRNSQGQMISFASIASWQWTFGPPKLERFNGTPSINIQGAAPHGISSGTAMHEIEKLVSKLPEGIAVAWSGTSYEEKSSQSQTLLLYMVSIFVVFLALAALYESWSIPIAIILSVPFGIMGIVAFCTVFQISNDIFFQVSLLTTIGLAAKNAILIVEFAKNSKDLDVVQASLEAIKLRFRPIIMTSLAFILGTLPLVFASGAGAISQKEIGVSVIGGMFFATFIATSFIPMFYVVIMKTSARIITSSLEQK